MDSPFFHQDSPEPHTVRREELLRNHPEVRSLFGTDASAAWIIVAVVALQIFFAWVVGRHEITAWIWVPFAWIVGGMLNHWLAMGVHESSHDLVFKKSHYNRWIAMVANIAIPFPAAMTFRRYHIDHHTYLGIEGRDNDLPSRWEASFKGSRIFKFIWMCLYLFFGTGARGFVKAPKRWEWINIAFITTTNIALYFLVGGWGLFYLLLATFLGHGPHPVAAHWVHEHYLFKKDQETYSYYGPLNWVTFNVGYHNEHHDLMWIPWTRLPRLKAMAPEFYNTLEISRSWTLIWIRFIWDRTLGHHSRRTRSMKKSNTLKVSTPKATPAIRPRILVYGTFAAFAAGVAISFQGGIFYGIGQALAGLAILRSFCVVHELSHGNVFKKKSINDFFGVITGILCILPYHSWKRIHMEHHFWTGWKSKDPTEDEVEFDTLHPAERFIANFSWKSWIPLIGIALLAKNFWNPGRFRSLFKSKKDFRLFLVSTGTIVGAHALCISFFGSFYAMFYLPALFICLAMFDPIAVSQHVGIPHMPKGVEPKPTPLAEQERFARTLVFPKWFSKHVLLGFNYHSLHHSHPSLPGQTLHSIPFKATYSENWLSWLIASKRATIGQLLSGTSESKPASKTATNGHSAAPLRSRKPKAKGKKRSSA